MKEEEPIDMETRIIEAAKIVFVRKGYEATKMGDIAAEVGISRTALHYYFRTKELLFEAIFGQLMGRLLPNIAILMEEASTILEKIPGIIEQYLSAIKQNPLFPIFIINEMNRNPEHLFQTIMKNSNRIQPLLQLKKQVYDEMENGLLKKRPLIDVASTLLSLVIFPFLIHLPLTAIFLDGDRKAFEKYIDNRASLIIEVMHHLLTPDKNRKQL
ncbi:MAG: TetR/AcrR family transcriptional regulator [Tannerellaceae bacterium]|jgi:AcrR family transcriptional regulator|nr:TetR/AcrR family transcriptional regulator [Tannerellaceae bacterium]